MPIHQLTPQEAKRMMESGEAVIVDLRGEEQFKEQHIRGAKNIPVEQIDVYQLPVKDKKLIVHCNRGGRAGRFCNAVNQADADAEIYNLQGGISAWIDAGLSTSS